MTIDLSPREVTLRDINSTLVNTETIAVVGKITAISEPEIIHSDIVYVCANSKCRRTYEKQTTVCDLGCGGTRFFEEPANLEDVQIIKIIEPKPTSNQIAKLVVVTRGTETMWKVRAGQKIRATGRLLIDPVILSLGHKPKPVKRLEATEIKALDNIDVKITEADIQRIKEMVQDPIHWQTLVDSFAPHIFGLEEQKEACIFTLGSCGTTRPFNSLLGGPPGRGKTLLLEWTANMHPIGFKLTATGASLAGLTSATEKDSDTDAFITKPGLFVLYDGGIVCITELQAIKNKEALKTQLNDALESKEVSGAKADGPIKLRARCAVLFDTNNFSGSWAYHFGLAHNLKYMEPNLGAFLSRLDLISISPEVNSDEYYANVARSNFKVTDTYEALEKFKDDYEIDGLTRYGVDTLVKYFTYITSLPLPPLTASTEQAFVDNFVAVSKDAKEYTVDGRYNRIVKTLAQVRARLLLKPEADEEDLEIAIEKVNKGKDIQTKTDDGENDGNRSLGLADKKKINREEQFWDAFAEASKEKGLTNQAERKDIIAWLVIRHQWTEDKAEKYLDNLNRYGKLMEDRSNGWVYTRV